MYLTDLHHSWNAPSENVVCIIVHELFQMLFWLTQAKVIWAEETEREKYLHQNGCGGFNMLGPYREWYWEGVAWLVEVCHRRGGLLRSPSLLKFREFPHSCLRMTVFSWPPSDQDVELLAYLAPCLPGHYHALCFVDNGLSLWTVSQSQWNIALYYKGCFGHGVSSQQWNPN